MNPTPTIPLRRRGFTFAEVMFAVILLGIGFIMLAGMFPVAIQQTRVTQEETLGANLATAAVKHITEVAYEVDFQPVAASNDWGKLVRLSGVTWDSLTPNMINPQDPRYAWTALYRRNLGENYIQVVIFGMQVRNASAFVPPTLPNDTVNNLTPKPITTGIELRDRDTTVSGDPDTVNFGSAGTPAWVNTGTYLTFAFRGRPLRVYRIGNPTSDPNKWELAPGFDIADKLDEEVSYTAFTQPSNDKVIVFGIGAGLENLANTTVYSGPTMGIASYVTFIHLK